MNLLYSLILFSFLFQDLHGMENMPLDTLARSSSAVVNTPTGSSLCRWATYFPWFVKPQQAKQTLSGLDILATEKALREVRQNRRNLSFDEKECEVLHSLGEIVDDFHAQVSYNVNGYQFVLKDILETQVLTRPLYGLPSIEEEVTDTAHQSIVVQTRYDLLKNQLDTLKEALLAQGKSDRVEIISNHQKRIKAFWDEYEDSTQGAIVAKNLRLANSCLHSLEALTCVDRTM